MSNANTHVKKEFRRCRCHPIFIWLGGGLTLLAALIVRFWCGSPYPLLHTLQAEEVLPPVWLLGLLWLAGFFLLGALCGAMLGRMGGGPVQTAWRFRGGMYFLLAVMLGLVWYPLLFCAQAMWLSWLVLLLSIAMVVLCTLCWMRVWWLVSVAGIGYLIWQVALLFMQLTVILR